MGRGPCERAFGTEGHGDDGGRGECLLGAAKDNSTVLWLGGAGGTNSTSSVEDTEMQGESSCVGATSGAANVLRSFAAGYSKVAGSSGSGCVAVSGCVDKSKTGGASECGPAGPKGCAFRWLACAAQRRLMMT